MGAETELLKSAKRGDRQALAQFLTWLEKNGPREAFRLSEILEPPTGSFRFGLTGPPGAGKSTLVAQLITALRKQNLSIAVLAVDPSSPFSKGAVLGDRIRYSEHFLDAGVFIRSLGTRGSLGGLSGAAYLMLRAFDVCQFDFVLVETVGVGQTELDILHVADKVGVVLVPESGDSIQAMKAGLMEIADIFVVNKADRPGADAMAREIEASVHDGESARQPKVIKSVATAATGVPELVQWLLEQKKIFSQSNSRNEPLRLREEAKSLLRAEWENAIDKKLLDIHSAVDLGVLFNKIKSSTTKGE